MLKSCIKKDPCHPIGIPCPVIVFFVPLVKMVQFWIHNNSPTIVWPSAVEAPPSTCRTLNCLVTLKSKIRRVETIQLMLILLICLFRGRCVNLPAHWDFVTLTTGWMVRQRPGGPRDLLGSCSCSYQLALISVCTLKSKLCLMSILHADRSLNSDLRLISLALVYRPNCLNEYQLNVFHKQYVHIIGWPIMFVYYMGPSTYTRYGVMIVHDKS